MKPHQPKDRLVKVYKAPTAAEAIVVRSLLKSVGINTSDFGTADPFPLHDVPEGWYRVEIWVPESRVEEARHIIAEPGKTDG